MSKPQLLWITDERNMGEKLTKSHWKDYVWAVQQCFCNDSINEQKRLCNSSNLFWQMNFENVSHLCSNTWVLLFESLISWDQWCHLQKRFQRVAPFFNALQYSEDNIFPSSVIGPLQLTDIRGKLKESKKFWSKLPDDICTTVNLTESDEEHCWNSHTKGRWGLMLCFKTAAKRLQLSHSTCQALK